MPKYVGEDDDNETVTELTEGDLRRLEQQEQRNKVEAAAKDWDPEREAHARKGDYHKTVICFNSACPDYKVERTDGSPCACRRTAIQGAGTNV